MFREWLDPWVGDHAPFTLYFVSITLSAWYCGFAPSLLAIALSAVLGSYLFAEPRGSLWIASLANQITFCLFLFVGTFVAFISDLLVRDVARRKRVEAALRDSQEQLQRHEAELAHAARLSTMGEMAAGLAHELNQPLQAVKNYARGGAWRLRKTPHPDQELVSVLGRIDAEAGRAAEIIRWIRHFVQKRGPRLCEVPFNKLVEAAVALSRSAIAERRAALVLELAANNPTVMADAIQIEQVLINLVRNGLEAMEGTPEGDRLIRIRTVRSDDHTLEVSVLDAGTGIAQENRARLFEPFFTTKPNGMGMGLAISRSIIQSHGGRLWASADGAGDSAFHFTLPLSTEQ